MQKYFCNLRFEKVANAILEKHQWSDFWKLLLASWAHFTYIRPWYPTSNTQHTIASNLSTSNLFVDLATSTCANPATCCCSGGDGGGGGGGRTESADDGGDGGGGGGRMTSVLLLRRSFSCSVFSLSFLRLSVSFAVERKMGKGKGSRIYEKG